MAAEIRLVRPKAPLDAPTRFLYVMNCGPDAGVSLDAAKALFAPFGPVEEVRIAGLHAMRVFVTFADALSAAAAKEALDEKPCAAVGDRVLKIEYAVPKRPPKVYDPVALSGVEMNIPGLSLHRNFVTEAEAETLLSDVDLSSWHPLSKRRVQHYGYEFVYKLNDVQRKGPLGPLPLFVCPLVERMEELAELRGAEEGCVPLDQMTANEYVKGVGLGPHVDTHMGFEGAVLSLSLGGPCVMQFRWEGGGATEGKRFLFLPPRSLLVLVGEARYGWSHYIPNHKADVVNGEVIERGERRVSLTFRKVRHGQCCCSYPHACDSWQKWAGGLVDLEEQEGGA